MFVRSFKFLKDITLLHYVPVNVIRIKRTTSSIYQLSVDPLTKEKLKSRAHDIQLPILDSSVPSPTLSKCPEDPLMPKIRSTGSLSQLLDFVSAHEQELEENHVTLITRLVFEFQKNPRTKFDIRSLHENPGFLKLCKKLRKIGPSFVECAELINSLKMLTMCQVPNDSRIMQSILHLIKSKINDLNLREIVYLHFLLNKLKHPLVDALKIALPLVFQTQLEEQMERDNTPLLATLLHYSTEHRLSHTTVKSIASCLSTCTENWNAQVSCSVLWSLSKIRNLEELELVPLVRFAADRLVDDISNCANKDLERTLIVLGESYSTKRLFWYHEQLCNLAARIIVQKKWSLNACAVAARTFAKLAFVNLDFLEYYADCVAFSESSHHPLYLLNCFSSADHKPKNLNRLMDTALKSSLLKQDKSDFPWIRFLMDCAVLGIYPQELIQRAFRESQLSKLLKSPSLLDLIQFNILYQGIKIECPDYQGPFPSEELLDKAHSTSLEFHVKDPLLESALQTALGGSYYIRSALLTKLGHFIDHVLVLRPGGYPVAINANGSNSSEMSRYVEDIKLPKDNKMIFFKVFRPICYASNADRLRGPHSLELRTLQQMGYNVIPIHYQKWVDLLEYERIPFLMQQIRVADEQL